MSTLDITHVTNVPGYPLHGVESLHGNKANNVIDLRYFETTLWLVHSNVGSESLHLSLHHSSGCYATKLWSQMVGFMLYSINQNSRVTMVYLPLHNSAKCMFHTSNQDHWIVAYFLLTYLSKWGHIVRIIVRNAIHYADSWLLLFGFKNDTANWTSLQDYSGNLCPCYSSVCVLTPIKAPLYYAQVEPITPTVDRPTGNDSPSILLDDGDMQ